ncbi:MAG: toll/interleukin-1 receptor domain-containing protein [Bacteroidota bacterium]
MDVFISWSGERSREFASALGRWLEMVIQSAKIWISTEDIAPGDRWARNLSGILDECDFGILCITPENIVAPWILFEAGALSKKLENAKVVPLLFEVSPGDLPSPLAQFHGVTADQKGVSALVGSILSSMNSDEIVSRVERACEKMWGVLENDWQEVSRRRVGAVLDRSEEKIDEMLELIRRISLSIDRPIYRTPDRYDIGLEVVLAERLDQMSKRAKELEESASSYEERFNDIPSPLSKEIENSKIRIEELMTALRALS